MLRQRDADIDSRIKQQRKDSRRKTALADCALHNFSDKLAGSGMGGMSFYDHRVPGRKSGGRVASRHRKRQRKIARAEDRHRSERSQQGTNVGSWRFALAIRFINASIHPRTLFQDLGKESQLSGGPVKFALKARQGQTTL